MKNIFVSGSLAYDEIMDFPHHFKDYFHPEKLHQINVSFVVSDLAKHLGGIATNISYALKKTGDYYACVIKSIYPVGAVGRDGDELLTFFKNNNIEITYVQKDEKLYTATGKVITDKNDNQIWGFYYGASSLVSLKLQDESSRKVEDFWIVSATHEKPFTQVLRHVIKNKLPYLFDPGMTLTWIRDDLLKKGVINAKFVVGNDYEIAMIEKRVKMTVEEMTKQGVNVITTLGEMGVNYFGGIQSKMNNNGDYIDSRLRGNDTGSGNDTRSGNDRTISLVSKYSHNPQEITVKAVKLKKVVDPTGAGDAWRGGFVGALVAGKSIQECLVMGNVMASFAVETVGTVEYSVRKDEIKKRIESISGK